MAVRQYRLGPLYRVIGVAAEAVVFLAGRRCRPARELPADPKSIFVLRNNDIGDLIVTTPLFDALRRRFPKAHIVAAVGSWNLAPLENNPHISEVFRLDAPWYNHFTSPRSIADAFRFARHSPVLGELKSRKFDIGIDVLGSHFGSMLMIRAGIPYRVGMKGYAGGHSALSATAPFTDREHVTRNILRLAESLGATDLPGPRPQLFLSDAERAAAECAWTNGRSAGLPRILIGCGGKSKKVWPIDYWRELGRGLSRRADVTLGIIGGPQDIEIGRQMQAATASDLNWTGSVTLRETFALVAAADLVICNDSMLSHVAAAFAKPALTLLGPSYDSASDQARVWGYPLPSRMVGKEGPGSQMTTPQEGLALIDEIGREVGFWPDGRSTR